MNEIRFVAAGALAALLCIGPAALAMLPKARAAGTKHHAAAAAPAAAKPQPAGTQTLGKADAWTAYSSQDKTGRVCFVVGQPQKSEPTGFARRAPMAMVTHRPAEKIANVVSFVEGYPLKDGSELALDVGGSKYELFTKDDSAWARTAELDKTIVSALAKAHSAVVKGVAQKGGTTTDVYPLAGFAKTLALIDKACGVQRAEKPQPPHHRAAKTARH